MYPLIRMKLAILAVSSVLGLGFSATADAALLDRGNGLIYDDTLGMTWLQDANLAASNTFGIGDIGRTAPGNMQWVTAHLWIDAMNTAGYKGYSDWRLPNVAPAGATFDYRFNNNGATDVGYPIVNKGAELSFMHYVNLGNKGQYAGIAALNNGPFINLQNAGYWYGSEFAPGATSAWHFHTGMGLQGGIPKSLTIYAWAVRTGDVAPVPETSGAAMLLAGLALVGYVAHKHRRAPHGRRPQP